MASSIVPARVSQARARCPLRELVALGRPLAVGSVAERVDLGVHQSFREALDHLAQQI